MRHEPISLGPSSLGTTRALDIFAFGAEGARPKAYVQAAIHADEQPASLVAAALVRQLRALEAQGQIRGQVIVVPVANPIGLDQVSLGRHEGRHDLRTGGNFNRDFPDLTGDLLQALKGQGDRSIEAVRRHAAALLEAWRTVGELSALRRALMQLAIDADLVLDLHTGHGRGLVHLFMSGRDWPALADLASDVGADAVYWHSPFPRNSTFTASVGAIWAKLEEQRPDLGVPQGCQAAVIEYRGQSDFSPDMAEGDAANLVRYLMRRGIVAGDAALPGKTAELTGAVDCVEIGYASAPGTLHFAKEVGDDIRRGDVVCRIIDASRPFDGPAEVRARSHGRLLTRESDGVVCWPNRMIFSVAGTEPVAPVPGMADMRA